MSKLAGNSRAALLGALFAIVGFSYAIASSTAVSDSGGRSVGARGVGTSPLHYTNPIDAGSGERDLGDIVAGSSFVRWIRAAGGVQPYKFVSSNADSPSLATAIPNSGAQFANLLIKGELIGSIASTFTTNPVRFQVTCTDSGGSNPQVVREIFRLNLITGDTFRFASDSVPSAVQFQNYVSKIEVLNGKGPFTYTVSGITLDGAAKTSLQSVGLQINSADGTIFGKPLSSGALVFTVRVVDANGAVALGRSPSTTNDQQFTLQIDANKITTSNAIATAITIKGDTAVPGKDSISYSGYVNLGATAISALSGKQLFLRVGSYVNQDTDATPAELDEKGKTQKPTVKDKTAPTFKGAVSSKGTVKITAGKETLGNKLGSFTGSGTNILAVSVQVGDVIIGTEILSFSVKTSGTKFQLTYKLGTDLPLAGGFIVTSVAGKDDKAGTGDAWKVAFIALPENGGTAGNSGNFRAGSFAQSSSAVVSIGANFSDSIGVSESKDKVKTTEKASKNDNQVSKVALDAKKGKGSYQTTNVTSAQSGIALAGTAGDGNKTNFITNVTLTQGANGAGNVIYAGEGSAAIFAKKTSWSNKNPNK